MTRFTLEQLRERHTLPNSRFAEFGGVPVHYIDEGEGPKTPVVLLHGSFLDLTSYDSWAAELGRDRRVLRLDRLRFGLTGHANEGPIDYADEGALLEAFVDGLGLDRFVLAGTSSGGMVAARYAAMHPQRVERLILMNFPIGHSRIKPTAPIAEPSEPIDQRQMIRDVVRANLIDPSVASDQLLERLADYAQREDPKGAGAGAWNQAKTFTEEARRELLAKIEAPTLVVWSEFNRTLPLENGQIALDAVGAPQKHLLVVADAAHMHPLEKGAESARQVRVFLDGGTPAARTDG